MNSWTPNLQEFQELFSSENTLKILICLNQQEDKKACSSDISQLVDVHKSTAKKILESLYNNQFVEREVYTDKPGRPTYYTLAKNEFFVKLDLQYLSKDIQAGKQLPNPVIRESSRLPIDTDYELTEDGRIQTITYRRRTRARRLIRQRVELSSLEGDFMKYLPHPTMQAKPFLDICQQAGINEHYTVKKAYIFLKKMIELEIIEKIVPNYEK
ncbi:MAG: winged helix-turn-helix domain-containing protein [Candidatus Heimdallarchaeota archaeon]